MPRSARNGFTGHEVATTHGGTQNAGSCRYHHTDVVTWDADSIWLNTGGWRSSTTKHRMNQTAAHYALGFWVRQLGGQWYVTTKAGTFVWPSESCRIGRSTGSIARAPLSSRRRPSQ